MRANPPQLRKASPAPPRVKAKPLTGSAMRATMPAAAPVVAIVGATGAVGVELLRCLEARKFSLRGLKLLASSRSAGKTLPFRGENLVVEELDERSFDGVDLALFSAGATTSRHYAPLAVRAGAVVVDNSSAFRMMPAVPLVIPEINPGEIAGHRGIIANPNCSTIVAITPLWPIHTPTAHGKTRPPWRMMLLSTTMWSVRSGSGAMPASPIRTPPAPKSNTSQRRTAQSRQPLRNQMP